MTQIVGFELDFFHTCFSVCAFEFTLQYFHSLFIKFNCGQTVNYFEKFIYFHNYFIHFTVDKVQVHFLEPYFATHFEIDSHCSGKGIAFHFSNFKLSSHEVGMVN